MQRGSRLTSFNMKNAESALFTMSSNQVLPHPLFLNCANLVQFFPGSHLIFCAVVTVLDFINLLSSRRRQINFSHPRLLHTQMPDKSCNSFCLLLKINTFNVSARTSHENHLFQRNDKCPEFSGPRVGHHGKAGASLTTCQQSQLLLMSQLSQLSPIDVN